MASEFDPDMMLQYYGVYPLYYGTTWPELPIELGRIYNDKISQIPWLPEQWTSVIMPSMTGQQQVFYVPAPSTATFYNKTTGKTERGAQFLDTPEKQAWWDDFASQVASAVTKYAAYQAELGKKELANIYANQQMLDTAISLVNLAAAPVNFAKDVASTYQKFQGAIHATLVIGGVGLLAMMFLRRK